jgi:phosphoribosylformylglycinamidine cyclo-ligase
MHRVFNCGIGMILVVAPTHANEAIGILQRAGETAWRIGEIKSRGTDEMPATIVL